MARVAFCCNLATSFAGGGFAFQSAHQPSSSIDVAAGAAHLDTLITDVGTAQSTAATAKTSTATSKADGVAVQAANVAATPCENALATLEADGEGSYTLAHVQAVRTQWDIVHAGTLAQAGLANAVKNSTETADTDTGLAKTAADALSTTDLSEHLASIVVEDAADVVLDINTTNVTTQSAVRAALRHLQQALAGSGLPS